MARMPSGRWIELVAALALLSLVASTAGAAPIPSYTVTDLGTGSARLSNTGADATLTAPDGRSTYAFPRTDNLVANPQPLLDTFPPFTNAPTYETMTYGNPKNAYSYLDPSNVFLNKAGEFAATDLTGVAGHSAASGSAVETATRQADGSFGPLGGLWSTHDNRYSQGQVAWVLDLNNAGQMLGVDAGSGQYNGSRDFFVYDLHSRLRTELAPLLPAGWTVDGWPVALDDRGRILLYADGPYVSGHFTHTNELLLLTPAGLASGPIATPEPSTLATLAVAAVGVAYRRRRMCQSKS